jgi:hypothetical protein
LGANNIPVVKVNHNNDLFNSINPNLISLVNINPTRYTPIIEISSHKEYSLFSFTLISLLMIEKKIPLIQINPEKMLTNDFEYGKLNTNIENNTTVDISLIFSQLICLIFSLIDCL